jgi:hypothetical protein
MSQEAMNLSQSITETAREVDMRVKNHWKKAPVTDNAELVAARLTLERLLEQAKQLDELLYKHAQEEMR